jgi:hypothetical protein
MMSFDIINKTYIRVLYRVEPLPCNDREMGDIAGCFLGTGSVNTFSLLGSRFLIMRQLDHNNGRVVFIVWSVARCYKQRDKVS